MNACWKWMGLLPVAAVLGCSPTETPGTGKVPRVCTTFYPTTYFTQRIGGDLVEVVCPLPADEDPIFWVPAPEAVDQYQKADLIVINGADFELWVGLVSLPPSKTVDTAGPLGQELMRYQGAVAHSHGAGGQHAHQGIDGHTWLDPQNAKTQADEIRKALQRLLPEAADQLQANYAALAVDLDALHQALLELSGVIKDRHLLASHQAYNYLAKRYGWNLTSLDLDPEKMPDEKTLAGIRRKLESKPAGIILWESRPADEIAARFNDELGLVSVVFSPCEQPPEGSDYIGVMNQNVARLREATSR